MPVIVKCNPSEYGALINGKKTFEFFNSIEQPLSVGDYFIITPWESEVSDKFFLARAVYIQRNDNFMTKDNRVVGFEVCSVVAGVGFGRNVCAGELGRLNEPYVGGKDTD